MLVTGMSGKDKRMLVKQIVEAESKGGELWLKYLFLQFYNCKSNFFIMFR